jgi:subtilisin family serine protease
VVAPGVNIPTVRFNSDVDQFTSFSGCSAATPVVSGIATLLLSLNPLLTHNAVLNILTHTAEDVVGPPTEDPPGRDDFFGRGRVNMDGALRFLSDSGDGLLLTGPSPGVTGMVNTVDVSGGTPGSTIFFGFGFQSGSTTIPGCPAATVGILNAQLGGGDVVDGTGQASLNSFVPPTASGRTVLLQALERSSCRVSNLVTYPFP